jgi:hypothetical protein
MNNPDQGPETDSSPLRSYALERHRRDGKDWLITASNRLHGMERVGVKVSGLNDVGDITAMSIR